MSRDPNRPTGQEKVSSRMTRARPRRDALGFEGTEHGLDVRDAEIVDVRDEKASAPPETVGPAAEPTGEDLSQAVQGALLPFFSIVGEAFGVIEDRQVSTERLLGDMRRRLDQLEPAAQGPQLSLTAVEAALTRMEVALADIRGQLTLLDDLPEVHQPLAPLVETMFRRIEASQASMEKLIGELTVRLRSESGLPPERAVRQRPQL